MRSEAEGYGRQEQAFRYLCYPTSSYLNCESEKCYRLTPGARAVTFDCTEIIRAVQFWCIFVESLLPWGVKQLWIRGILHFAGGQLMSLAACKITVAQENIQCSFWILVSNRIRG